MLAPPPPPLLGFVVLVVDDEDEVVDDSSNTLLRSIVVSVVDVVVDVLTVVVVALSVVVGFTVVVVGFAVVVVVAGAETVMVPVICAGWNLQWYGNVPGLEKVSCAVAAGSTTCSAKVPLSHVTECWMASQFVHTTESPTLNERLPPPE